MLDNFAKTVDSQLENIDQDIRDNTNRATKIASWIRRCYKVDDDFLVPVFVLRIHIATYGGDEAIDDPKTVLAFYQQYNKNLEYVNDKYLKKKKKK